MSFDSVIVGGGVMGSAIALRLAQAGQKVLVLEKSVPGAEASSAAGGILGPQIEGEADGPLFRLCLRSRDAWSALADELRESTGVDIGYRQRGLLKVALREEEIDGLEERLRWQAELGLRVERISGEAARALEPSLADSIRAALYFPAEAQVDPRALMEALPRAARGAGAVFRPAQVRKVLVEDGRAMGVELQDEKIFASAVVVAAGAWTSMVEGIGLPADAVEPVRGQMLRLSPPSPSLSRVVFTSRGYLVPREDGSVLCGSTMERVGYDKRVTAAGVASILHNALSALPALGDSTILQSWSGLRPAPADGLPLIGRGAVAGLHLASGHHRNGILLTPETARLVAECVIDGQEPELLRPFSPSRFAR